MTLSNFRDRQEDRQLSRRAVLGGLGSAAFLSLFPGKLSAEEKLPPPRFLLEWGKRGSGEGEFSACVGIAIGKDDVVYTAEFRNQRVQRFTPEGKFLGAFPVQAH